MASRVAIKKLTREYNDMMAHPVDGVRVAPDPNNMLKWYYVLIGPENSPYAKGNYCGVLTFPENYPMGPPGIMMITPNGRFLPNKKICTTMSDYHPETWSPAWTLTNILVGLLSFMLDKDTAVGCCESTDKEKIKLAGQSLAYNLDKIPNFRTYFPEFK